MNENSNTNNEKTIEMNPMNDEEVQVFQIEDLNFDDEITSDTISETIRAKTTKVQRTESNTKNKQRTKTKGTKKTKDKKHKDKKTKKVKTKEKQSKRNVGMILIILTLVAGGIFASWKFYFSFDEYNPFDSIQIVEKGADTQAYLEIEKDDIVLDEKESLIRDLVEFAIVKNQDLSTGDVREITVVLDASSKEILKQNKIRLTPLSMEYTVGRVGNLESIDVLGTLDISYEVEGSKVRVDQLSPQVSDLNLKDLLILQTGKDLLSFGDTFTVTIKETPALASYLLEHGYTIEEMKRDYTVESFEFIPEKLSDLGNLDSMSDEALKSLEANLNESEVVYKDFQVKQVCYTSDASNSENARDKNYGHEYTKGSLMFITEFKNIEDSKVYADVIGYTNIVMNEDEIDKNQILEMNPLYEKASLDMVKRDMVQNGFSCSNY